MYRINSWFTLIKFFAKSQLDDDNNDELGRFIILKKISFSILSIITLQLNSYCAKKQFFLIIRSKICNFN